MRKFLYGVLAWCAMSAVSISANAADAHRAYNRPALSFAPASFSVSYGTTTNICVTVTPARKASVFANPNVWKNSVPGMFEITPGTDPSCTGAGKVFLSVLSKIDDVCLPQGDVRGVLNNKSAGSAQGTVILPNQEVARLKSNSSSQGVISADWRVTFTNNAAASNFNGLTTGELLWIASGDPNGCGMSTGPGFETKDWVLGSVTAGDNTRGNSLVDATTKNVGMTESCKSIVSQAFHIGQCIIPSVDTPIKITFEFVSGAPLLTRSDGVP